MLNKGRILGVLFTKLSRLRIEVLIVMKAEY